MIDSHIETWVAQILDNRADQTWSPILLMNARTANGEAITHGVTITVDETVPDGIVQISADIAGERQLMAQYQFSVPAAPPSPESPQAQ